MKLRLQQGGVLSRPPTEAGDVEYVVVFDRFDQPLAVIEEIGQDVIRVLTPSNADFAATLRRLGVIERVPPSTVIQDGRC